MATDRVAAQGWTPGTFVNDSSSVPLEAAFFNAVTGALGHGGVSFNADTVGTYAPGQTGTGYIPYVNASGRIGIGKVPTTYTLEVGGTIEADNKIYSGYGMYPGVAGTVQVSHYIAGNTVGIGIDRTPTTYSFEVQGDVYATTSVVSGSFYSSSSLTAVSTYAGASYIVASDAAGAFIIQTGGSNNRVTINAGGLVGIGRTATNQTLEVQGNAALWSSTEAQVHVITTASGSANDCYLYNNVVSWGLYSASDGNGVLIQRIKSSGNVLINGAKVGVNRTPTTYAFEVAGDVYATGYNYVSVVRADSLPTASATQYGLFYYISGSSSLYFCYYTGSAYAWKTI